MNELCSGPDSKVEAEVVKINNHFGLVRLKV